MRPLPMSSPGSSSPVELHCLGPWAVALAIAFATAGAGLALAAARVPGPALGSVLAVALLPAAGLLGRPADGPRLRLVGDQAWLVATGGAPVPVRCTRGWVLGGQIAGLVLVPPAGRAVPVYLVRSGCPPHGWRCLRLFLACR
jgi:hypothetical protein